MDIKRIAHQNVTFHRHNTVIVGAGAAGMNCAVRLCDFLTQIGVADAGARVAVVTGGLPLGASRMSGSDKQTYYKMGTSPEVADSAEAFAQSLTAGGCTHGDLALIEAVGSLRGFYNLVQAGVPFPHDPLGSYIGYKTDHDPYERATSAGPKTSKFMSECLEAQARRYGVSMYDHQEMAEILTDGEGAAARGIGVVTMDRTAAKDGEYGVNVFLAENVVLAGGGPGEMYATTVYPRGQWGYHGLAFRAGLAAENLTESQFGLASIKFRWNVSGTYMQALPRIYSTDADGNDAREFLADFFPTMSKLATNIFLKGYQWPFDPQRIENLQSSLVDVLVFNETQRGRRVWMDFLRNPVGKDGMDAFDLDDLEPEALDYLRKTGALQATPIERLAHMNTPAIDIYTENGIDLYKEPLEIAVCAQHNNGGFAVDTWWQSSVKHVFVVGEMAGTHGVKRPGGSALNAGQTGALRAAEYISQVYGPEVPSQAAIDKAADKVAAVIERLGKLGGGTRRAAEVIDEIRGRMTASAGHIRELGDARRALADACQLYQAVSAEGLAAAGTDQLAAAVRAEHLALASVAYLKAVAALLEAGEGSRGSHLVLSADGVAVHEDVRDPRGKVLRFKPENIALRDTILRVRHAPDAADRFAVESVPVRSAPKQREAFEPAWKAFREKRIFG